MSATIEAVQAQVGTAVRAAAEAAGSAALADRRRRAALLRGAASSLRERRDEVVATCAAETGLSSARLERELERTAGQLEAFAGVVEEGSYVEATIDRGDPDAHPLPRPDVRRMLVPIGPVAVFGAGNFPLAFSVLGGDTGSALAAGCPVVVKGHPGHARTSALAAELLLAAARDAGLPDGTVAHVAGGVEPGEALVDAPEVAAVAFTGSLRGGRALFDRAARRPVPIPVFAEMGAVNPVVVTEAALAARADAIAAGLAASTTTDGGQLCTKPGVALVPAGDAGDAFVADVGRRMAEAGPQRLLGAPTCSALDAGLEELAAVPGVRRVTPPADAPGDDLRRAPTAFEAPTSALAGPRAAALLEERFGPALVVLRYAGRADLRAAVSAFPGQLAAAVHADPEADADLLAEVLPLLRDRVGRLVFGAFPTGVSVGWAMQHGGPYPATTAPSSTSVGLTALQRFLRPVAWQDAPQAVLPEALRDGNPLGLVRRVDGDLVRA